MSPEVRRLGPQIGVEIKGVDVRKLDDAGFAIIYRAWLDGNVAVVPGQTLEIDDFLAYSRRFGQVVPHPSKMTRHPEHFLRCRSSSARIAPSISSSR